MKLSKKDYISWIAKPHVVFAVLASVSGILSAFLVPQLTVNDENMHFLRTYNLASGTLGNKDCRYPVDINTKAGSVYTGEASAHYRQKIDFSKTIDASCGTAAGYSPIMHIPQTIGVFIAKQLYPSSGLMVLLGRLANLAFYIIALYYVIKNVRIGKWVFVVIGLLPSMIHMAASLSGDVMNNIVVLAMVAFIYNLFTQKARISKKQTIMLLCLVCALSLTKVTNILLLLPLLLLPAGLFAKNKSRRIPFNLHKWGVAVAGVVLAAISITGWQKIYSVSLAGTPVENPLASNPLGFIEILINTYISPFFGYNDTIFRGIVGEFASFQYHLPIFMIMLSLFLLLITMLHKDKDEERLIKPVSRALILSTFGVLCVLIVVISYALYTAWAIQPFRLGPGAPYADGVQGRYFTALLVLLIPLFIWLRRFLTVSAGSPLRLGILVFTVSAFSLAFYIVETYLFIT